MPPISVLMKPASGMCNMKCEYSFYCDKMDKRSKESFGFMSEETLRNVIRKTMLRAEGFVSYAYQGGEPTLRGIDFFRKAVAFQKQYNRHGIQVNNALQTNGYLLDEEWCLFLKENQFLVGLSVDGTAKYHDALRHSKTGEGTFERVCRSAELMDRFQVDYNILTVVTPQIARHIEEIYPEYQRRGWHYQQYIACLDPLGEGHGRTEYSLTPEEYGAFLDRLFALWYRDYQKGRQPYIRQFDNYIGMAKGYPPEACDQRGTCGIQNVVEADGSVYPCDFYMLDEYLLGNFNKDRLDAIDERRREIGFVERSCLLNEACRECNYYGLCRGGCQRHRDYNEKTGRYDNYFCRAYKIFFDRWYETIMREFG